MTGGENRDRTKPLSSVNTIAPVAPKTVNCSSTSTPMPVEAAQPRAGRIVIAAPQANAKRVRPCWAKARPWPRPWNSPLIALTSPL